MSKLKHSDYAVGWICALPLELAAAAETLDEEHSSLPQKPHDNNNYTLGRIGDHNVVIACLPSGVTGTNPAAVVASLLLSAFSSIRVGLMVGIGGGAPSLDHDIRLGDLVVSRPTATSGAGGVIQYDLGKTIQEGRFIQTGSLNKPPGVLLKALSSLEARHDRGKGNLPEHLSKILSNPKLGKKSAYQGAQEDHLFEADYDHLIHPEGNPTCAKCEPNRLVTRDDREDELPMVHYGLIASANQVMRDGVTREKLRKELNVLCFEMEAAGLMDHFPCLVIRGLCDYADTHKNKRWQFYAAAVAAAYAKELLCIIPQLQVIQTEKAKQCE